MAALPRTLRQRRASREQVVPEARMCDLQAK